MKKLLKLLGIIVGIVFAIGLVGAIFGEKPTSGAPTASNSTSEQPKPAETVSVTAAALFDAYDKNEVAADQKYKGKALSVSGTIQSIDKDAFDNIVVKLRTSNEFMPVNAYLSKEHEAFAATLEKGKKVTWTCEGNGRLIGSPILRDCTPA
ncbi:OB-fold putative lipoprotein [Burkholderia multivorans]|uniref:OB-fold putative lipoprotein n=1 Tax=Burkholderia multivorans TaxID=87883 RepID=UPI001C26CFB4|nr:OB-fold putative lipoprotein [Burkholderia multivorans]MBU9520250.1 OB-fold putative lipoprotein [Burkholderia multivorans]